MSILHDLGNILQLLFYAAGFVFFGWLIIAPWLKK